MMFSKNQLVPIALMASSLAFGHGENKPGPHGGEIRMPGGFHTELVKTDNRSFDVFLLNINITEPTIVNSSVELIFKTAKESRSTVCDRQEKSFKCQLPDDLKMQDVQEVQVQATRSGLIGGLAIYPISKGKHSK